jgi:hydrogenase maturation protease
MNTTLVIGYGNTLRGDDGAGVRAAELIGGRYDNVDVVSVQELKPELSERIARYHTVIFIDASQNTTELKVGRLEDLPGQQGQHRTLSHVHTPKDLMALCKELYKHVPETCVLMEIPASNFSFSEKLSPETARAVNRCVEVYGRMFDPSSDTSEDLY